MKRFLLILAITGFIGLASRAQCPIGASALESSYVICPLGCGVLLVNWPQGVIVNIYGGTPLVIVTSGVVSGTFGSSGVGSAFVCTPCDTPLVFASSVPNAKNGCVIISGGVVPIKLTNFSAAASNGITTLEWSTLFTSGKANYIVQRSTDSKMYTDIVTIAALANGTAQNNYSYKDNLPKAGNYFYRIKIVEESGGVSYSATAPVNSDQSFSGITVSPNPVINNITIALPGSFLPASVTIYDAQGTLMVSGQTSQTTFVLNKPLPKGIYTIKVIGNNNVIATQKIIKE